MRWADVWIATTVKPGRTRLRLAPTLIGLDDLLDEEAMNVKMKWKSDPDHAAAKVAFAAGKTYCIGGGPKDMANVYSCDATISKSVAEELCLAYAQSCGVKAARVKWERSKIFTTPF